MTISRKAVATYTPEERNARVDRLVGRFRQADGRITSQRLAIIRALVDDDNHPSAEDIYREVRRNFPTLSLATVYKTLERLKAMGEVLELEFREGSNRYDGMRPSPHTHLMCTVCGRILDLELAVRLPRVTSAARASGFQLGAVRFDLYGVCEGCRGRRR